jgi:hypothetical protein
MSLIHDIVLVCLMSQTESRNPSFVLFFLTSISVIMSCLCYRVEEYLFVRVSILSEVFSFSLEA